MPGFKHQWLAALLATTSISLAQAADRSDELRWMQGAWAGESNGEWSEEHWTTPRGGLLLGVNRSGQGDTAKAHEFLRIAVDADGTPVYWGSAPNAAPVPFRLTESRENAATFENAQHDFPQRIRYERNGDTLTATISDLAGKQSQSWTWTRQP